MSKHDTPTIVRLDEAPLMWCPIHVTPTIVEMSEPLQAFYDRSNNTILCTRSDVTDERLTAKWQQWMALQHLASALPKDMEVKMSDSQFLGLSLTILVDIHKTLGAIELVVRHTDKGYIVNQPLIMFSQFYPKSTGLAVWLALKRPHFNPDTTMSFDAVVALVR